MKIFSYYRALIALLSVLACSGDAPTEPSGVPGVYVTGVVRDSEGNPMPSVTVTWEAWPAPDSVDQGAVSDFSVTWFMRADSAGRFGAHVGYYSRSMLDSLEVGVAVDECWGVAPLQSRERALPVTPGVPDTVLDASLTLDRTAPRARLALGTACAVIVGPPPDEFEDRLGLWIDEISDSVRGRWLIDFQGSFGTDHGHFSGARVGDLLTLHLRHDPPGPAYGECTGYTVEVPVESGDSLGIGSHGTDGCLYTAAPLRFVQSEPYAWPF